MCVFITLGVHVIRMEDTRLSALTTLDELAIRVQDIRNKFLPLGKRVISAEDTKLSVPSSLVNLWKSLH